MNQHLQTILDFIQRAEHLSVEEKTALLKEAKAADKELEITAFKLERTEKVKHTTAVLLEETIEELEQKRKAVEAQNKELEIEAALEKVRSRSLAMHKSDELNEVVAILFEKLKELQIPVTAVGIGIYIDGSKDMNSFVCGENKNGLVINNYRLPYFHHKIWEDFNKARKKQLDFFTGNYSKEEKNSFYEYLFEHVAALRHLPDDIKSLIFESPTYTISMVGVNNALFNINDFEGKNLSENEIDIIKRFARVFDQAYTRFLDLQKAEAHAREAQIELGLERVRARAMAMHGSDELKELVKTLFEELIRVDVDLSACLISTFDISTLDERSWMFHPITREPYVIRVPYNEQSFYHEMLRAWKERNTAWNYCLKGEIKVKWHDFLFADTEFALLPQSVIDEMRRPDKVFFTASYYSYGAIQVASLEPFPAQSIDIIQRFSKVFDLSYTRFLDLQKAEEQARESQIELALERIRARTMAMQHSDELSETASLLFEQVQSFGVALWSCGFNISEKGEKECTSFITRGGKMLPPVKVPLTENSSMQLIYEFRERGVDFWYKEMADEEIKELFSYIARQRNKNNPGDNQFLTGVTLPAFQIAHFVNFSHGNLMFITLEAHPEMHDIFKRFGKVFQQTYTRFLDLLKAEAQAREGQIELALERVRARTMAMQRSDELREAVLVIYEQLQQLNFESKACNIIIIDKESGSAQYWVSGFSQEVFPESYTVPYLNHPYQDELLKPWKRGDKYVVYRYTGKMKQSFDEIFFTKTEFRNVPEDAKKVMIGLESVVLSTAFISCGALQALGAEPLSEEDANILRRFAKVFEQTYTRFLDLQKAEAQARESQIQLALERVRARTMAMQKHEDLLGVLGLLVEQLIKLGVQLEVANFSNGIPNGDWNLWIEVVRGDGTSVNNYVLFPRIDHPYFHQVEKNIETFKSTGKDLFKDVFSKEEKDLWQEYVYTQTIYKNITAEKDWEYLYDKPGYTWSMILLKDTWVSICRYNTSPFSDEEDALFRRFVNAFGQAYTRFLDLKKAEAQAREAQIEAALERVRSSSLAMHQSEDIQHVVHELYTRLLELNIRLDSANILFFKEGSRDIECWTGSNITKYQQATLPYADHDFLKKINEAHENGSELFKGWYTKEKKDALFKYFFEETELKLVPADRKKFVFSGHHHACSLALVQHVGVNLNRFFEEPFSAEEDSILKRFSRVFHQAYTRFLDLQKAEAQAREAQIEVALERVRARAMAMQKSDELKELIGTVFIELTKLDLVLTRCLIMIYDTTTNGSTWWMANSEAPSDPIGLFVKYHEHPPYLAYINAWKERNLKWQYILEGAVKKEWDDFLFVETELSLLPDFVIEGMKAPDRVYLNSSFNSFGNLTLASLEPLSDEHFDILLRFAKVFDLTYTRFNDLKQAEAQAREAKIEAALERVRARTMAMHNSEDVVNATSVLLNELRKLGIETLRCGILIFQQSETFEVWSVTNTVEGETVRSISTFNTNDHPLWQGLYKSWKQGDEFFYYYLAGEEKKAYYRILSNTPNYLSVQVNELPDQNFQGYCFIEGAIWTFSLQPHSEEDKQVMKKFTSVFSLTFRRYQDLKKAEAQAREATIEAALERVRARTMAMFKSDELAETAVVVFQQLINFGIEPNRLYIGIINDESGDLEFWITDEEGKQVSKRYVVNIHKNISIKKMYEGWKEQRQTLSVDMQGNELHEWITYWNKEFGVPFMQGAGQQRRVQNLSYFSKGFIATTTFENAPKETVSLLNRFAAVFNLTYTRFNDLQLAEAQTREATIEAALEKVRGKAMAMHNSNDLSVTASLVFTELRKLGINPIRCGVGLFNRESRKSQLYSAISSPDGDSLSLVGWVMMTEHPVLEKIYESWLSNEEYYPELQGEQLRSYYQLFLKGLPVAMPDIDAGKKQYGHFLPFSIGCLNTWSDRPHNESEIKILRRFATIIDLTFRRYIELQKSEANAREAVKQAALDRVRAEIASMRTITDLDKITPLIWNELNILGVPFIRCGVFLMDDLQKLIHTFLSTPDGKAIAAFHLPYDTPGNFAEMIKRWHNKQIYIDHWGETEFISMAETLVKQGAIATKEQYLNTLPDDGFYLHFLPFLQGMLYVGNTTKLGEEEIHLIQSVAEAFSTAYARYEDFNKLESAKVQIEKTLVDLKQTQAQLVQSEKMASLGELTAGIAHEIQNPLNFVNNFSEVSTELLDEMITELKSDNKEDAIAIADDVKQNLEKILHHGKRADGIVKGMLQHSRSSSATKEATDINKLADEYLRLAYHGLRAKDKSFNATMITDYDETIGNINIIPQDIGRVILNLIMNAFYTVAEKKKQMHDHYEPTVSLTTKKINDKIEIKIRDNGNGIPGKVIDKIFQPFFTTKPTGQGTGLGLSLAYDIIKTHNGELKVDTKEGEGSEFIIQLPV